MQGAAARESGGVAGIAPCVCGADWRTLFPAVVQDWCLVWTLCEALWGHLKELEALLDEPSEYILALERRKAFSRWLSQTAAGRIEDEVSLSQQDHPAEAVFSYLTGKQISEACQLAQQSGKAVSPSKRAVQ